MVALSSARFLSNFFTSWRRLYSRLINASFAMAASVLEREFERGEQRFGFRVRLRRGGDRDVHAPQRIDFVVIDFRENDLFFDAHVEIAAAVEGASRHAEIGRAHV